VIMPANSPLTAYLDDSLNWDLAYQDRLTNIYNLLEE